MDNQHDYFINLIAAVKCEAQTIMQCAARLSVRLDDLEEQLVELELANSLDPAREHVLKAVTRSSS